MRYGTSQVRYWSDTMQDIPKSELFGSTFQCICGRTHSIDPKALVYSKDAVEQVSEMIGTWVENKRVAVIMDIRTQKVAGDGLIRQLLRDGWQTSRHVVPDPQPGSPPLCDDLTKQDLSERLHDTDMILTVGSGVVTDLGKWLAADRQVPFVAFATAASMNGYASANVAPTIRGVKTLLRAKPPLLVASSPAILRETPYEMTASGLGDILAKSVSCIDWYLNHLLFDDYYCEKSVNLISEIEPLYLNAPEQLRDRSPDSLQALFEGLVLTGVAMTMAGTSSPSSGGEHMVSHTLDMMSSVDGAEHDLHGRQVGVGTILASEIYQRVLNLESPEFKPPTSATDRSFWGPLQNVVSEKYAQKLPRLQKAFETISQGDAWDELRGDLKPMERPPSVIRDCLLRAGGAHKPEHIRCTRDRLLKALLHGHEIRERFTILDLARLVGIMPGAALDIIDEWM